MHVKQKVRSVAEERAGEDPEMQQIFLQFTKIISVPCFSLTFSGLNGEKQRMCRYPSAATSCGGGLGAGTLSSFRNVLLVYTSVQVAILLCFLSDSSLMSSPEGFLLFENQTFPFKAAVSKPFFFNI